MTIYRSYLRRPSSWLAATLVSLTLSASGQIEVLGSNNFIGNNPSEGTFNAFGADKIVVITTGEHGFNQTANGDGGQVTFGGVEMIQAVDRNAIKAVEGPPTVLVDDTWNDLWYLDAADFTDGTFPDAELTLSAIAVSRSSVTIIALSGTAPGVGNTVIGNRDTNSADLTTSSGSLVISSYGMGGTGNSALLGQVSVEEPMIEVSRQNNGGGRWWDGHVVSYTNGVAAGTATYTFTDSGSPEADGRTGRHVIAAEFLSVGGGADWAITDIDFNAETNEVTLTWPKTGAPSYNVDLSPDLIDWESNLATGITDDQDENTEDPDQLTVTLPLPVEVEGSTRLFFRAEVE